MEELLFEPGPDPFGLCSSIQIGDPVQRTVHGNPRKMRLHSEPGTERIGVVARFLLALPPELPAIPRRHEAGLAQNVEVPKVTRRTVLHQGKYLARHEVGEAVQRHLGPGFQADRFRHLVPKISRAGGPTA